MEYDRTFYQATSEEERASFRQWLKDLLHQQTITVTFNKKDGTTRLMKCTLKEGIAIPHEKTTDRVKEVNQDVCPVWDIDKNAWRSFTYQSITRVQYDVEQQN